MANKASFNLEKGGGFKLDKGIQRVLVGLGWEASVDPSVPFDPDANAFGLSNKGGSPSLFNGGSHALTYANNDLVKGANKSFSTNDGSMTHNGDNRVGTDGASDAEQMKITLSKLPDDLDEIAVWITIYKATKRNQSFANINKAYVRLTDEDSGEELCRYNLQNEFKGAKSVQVGSFMKDDDTWTFKAVGAGAPVELGDVLAKYQA